MVNGGADEERLKPMQLAVLTYLFFEKKSIKHLAEKGIDIFKLNLQDLSDNDDNLTSIVEEAIVALETKISFRYYEKGHVNFIIDEVRKKRYETWLSRTKNIGCLVIWFTLNKAFITPMDLILSNGTEEERSYEGRGRLARIKKTLNFPVEKAEHFANVNGVRLNETLRPILKRSQSGAISITIEDDPGNLIDVNLEALERLAEQVKRKPS